MKQKPTYQFFQKSIVFILLLSQLWVSIAPYCHLLMNGDSELIEISSAEDSESEEEKNKKEKDDKIRFDFLSSIFIDQKLKVNPLFFKDLLSLHHPEISTPPPEFSPSFL